MDVVGILLHVLVVLILIGLAIWVWLLKNIGLLAMYIFTHKPGAATVVISSFCLLGYIVRGWLHRREYNPLGVANSRHRSAVLENPAPEPELAD